MKWKGWMISCSVWRTSWCSADLEITCSWGQRYAGSKSDQERSDFSVFWKHWETLLTQISNPNRLNYNLYHWELFSFQLLRNKTKPKRNQTKPQQLEINYLSCSNWRRFRAKSWFRFLLPFSSFGLSQIKSDNLFELT